MTTATRRRMPAEHAVALALAEYEAGLLEPEKAVDVDYDYPFATDPVGFIVDRLGEFLWSGQIEICESVVVNRRTAVKSCHESGKSWTVARLVAWWLGEHEPGSAFVVTTAPSGPQVKTILWKEIGRAHSLGNLPGRTNMTEWLMEVTKVGPSGVPVTKEEIVAIGRKPSDYDPAAFQGIHARFVLVILDEADGIPESLYHAATSLAANEDSRIVAIGNPDDPASYFCSKVLKPDSGWNVIHIDGLKTPNFTDEFDDPKVAKKLVAMGRDPVKVLGELRELLIGPTYVEEARKDFGEGTPLWQSKVRGEVPKSSTDGVILLDWLNHCLLPRDDDDPWPDAELMPVELGVDVGAGGDRTVVYERRGRVAGRKWSARTPDPAEALELVLQALTEAPETSAIKVDAIGIGWGLCGMLELALADTRGAPRICPVNVSVAALDPTRFPLLRDQLWWDIGREFCRDRVWDLSAIDEGTQAQLIAPRYRRFGGRIKIEKKEDTKKRLGRSPDDADALLLAYYDPPEEQQEGIVVYDDPVGISPV